MRARLTSKGQITLPKPLRTALSIGTGDNVQFSIGTDGGVLLCKLSKPGMSAGCGAKFAKHTVSPSSHSDVEKAVADAMARRMHTSNASGNDEG